jgi:hypothetical protein
VCATFSSVIPSFGRHIPILRKNSNDTIFSFVVDSDPKYAYEGYHLARSLIQHCCRYASDIHVQFTEDVASSVRDVFSALGCSTHEIGRFGDGLFCNKIAQLPNLHTCRFSVVVLLDTDTIVLMDIRPHLNRGALLAKVVDLPNPSVETLREIASRAGMRVLPPLVTVDACAKLTYRGNCNGGFYAIPRRFCERVEKQWRRWALWLLDNLELLQREGKEAHVDQVAMWLVIHMGKIPYKTAPSNLNYYIHFAGDHRNFDPDFSIALIHYHHAFLNVLGQIEPSVALNELERRAVEKANEQIGQGFESTTFWNFRYGHFSERGSGVGSRGANLLYKRAVLVREGAEKADSVLDVGCGDLQVVKELALRSYLGLDTSEFALRIARRVRPDWEFRCFNFQKDIADGVPAKQMVLCFEVLIHQRSEADYQALIDFLARHTAQSLIVSGYEHDFEQRRGNPMLFFYEPLEESLRRTGIFAQIKKIGAHSDVSIYRCDV